MTVVLLQAFLAAATVELGGLRAETPADWRDITQNEALRVAEFCLPTKKEFAEVSALFLGEAREGIEERLKSKFRPPPSKTIDQVTTVQTLTTPATSIKLLEVRGTYRFFAIFLDRNRKSRPDDRPPSCLSQNLGNSGKGPDPRAQPAGHHMMVAGIMDTSKGPYVVSLVGPEKAVSSRRDEFIAWLKSFR